MTHKRLNNLLIAIIAFLTCLLIISTARAESDFSWHAGTFVTGDFAGGAGYSPGIGILGIGKIRYKFVELAVSVDTAWQKKKKATFGYTYGFAPALQFYVWKDFFVLGAYSIAGYASYFESGAQWTKSGANVGFGGGYDDGPTRISLTAYLKETGSPNNVAFTSLRIRQQIWKWVSAIGSVTYMTFDQMSGGERQRRSAMNFSVGIGCYF